jgi:signal transduction histidine kinase
VSIRFKVILPYLLLTLIVAVTGAYVVTRLVSQSLEERLSNQLLEAGRVVSDSMARQEIKQADAARLIAYTRGLAEALSAGDAERVSALAGPVTGGLNVESLLMYDQQGQESIHLILQTNNTYMDVTQRGSAPTLEIVSDLLAENNPNSLPRRALALDPVDRRYYYFTAIPVVFQQRVVGVTVVGTSLNIILPYLKNTSLADVILYDQNGLAIASTLGALGEDVLTQRTISIPQEFLQNVLSTSGTVQGQNIEVDQRWYTLAYGPLRVGEDTLAVFAVVLPLDFVVDSGVTNRNNYIMLYAAAMAAVILLGFFISRLIVTPLLKLVRASRAIANGDLTKRTEIRSGDEIGLLADTFDEMTDNLQQRTLELEKTNQILQQMDRTKMRFIQVAAHELRTPLTLTQGYAQMVQYKSKGNEELARFTRGILDGTSRMIEIIDNMLDVSRIDMNKLDVMPVEVRMDEIIEMVRKTFESALEERRLTFAVEGIEKLPALHGDKDLLYKLFYHVIGNAIKFTPDGGAITICGNERDRGEVEINIQDTGIGIDPENQKLVFEKFYQTGEVLLHSSGKTKFKGGGPGLGLAIARGIVESHRGRIWLESPGFDEATNPGTTVFVRLPINGPIHDKPQQ